MFIRFITTGGTIDKVYFDALSQFEVGDSPLQQMLTEGRVEFEYDVVPMLQKDSLEMTDEDREKQLEMIRTDYNWDMIAEETLKVYAGLRGSLKRGHNT